MLVQAINDWRYWVPEDRDDPDLQYYFGSVFKCQLVLLQSITGGVDWGQVHEALPDRWWFQGLYIAFIVFCNVALLNVITSWFVEEARRLGQTEEEAWYAK